MARDKLTLQTLTKAKFDIRL